MTVVSPHPNAELLRLLYTDFSQIHRYAAPDVRLHPADRTPGTVPLVGVAAFLSREKALVDATRGTLFMDVESVYANDFYGTVIGTLRATVDGEIAMPFCGLWRFADGRIVEHWQNAYDAPALVRALNGEW
ncbi:nuclear transport factor 2 family protein [Catenuloplanes indicus]|uniref:SnoaL-like domain-containing protein n=1 Tax=Catenuloplanes indicus TaxID=137267 RepID=A0AAE3W630_9ACTN|nr:nuclear transport factor 2 family protein [Catenuloplanes indicus]MDQ0369957.1 hypothetical protein [Catenuloplanes indicus]